VKITLKHAERLAAILEDHGWNVYGGGENSCPRCGQELNTNELLVYKFCPQCGNDLVTRPPKKDGMQYKSTHQLLVNCMKFALEK